MPRGVSFLVLDSPPSVTSEATMLKFILELRRREVFRTAGLYIGVCWIAIEVADVLIPAFELPDWIMRALIIAAVVGFPVMLVLAWVYDVTDKGIEVQAEATETVVIPFGDRKTDFVVIGVLAVALMISIYLNVADDAPEPTEKAPVSLLIADFRNDTGNTLFSGTLEQALALGIEGASFVTAYPRERALSLAESLDIGSTLDDEVSRLVAVRQDVDIVLAGEITAKGQGFELRLVATNASTGEQISEEKASADSAADVLMAMNELSADMRKALGDDKTRNDMVSSGETVTAASLQAMKHYVTAQDLAASGDDEEAIEFYKLALEEDPNLARAYSGWGLSAHKIGRPDEAEEQWQKALGLLDRMTERERYRTFGLYYTVVSRNYDKAIENYQQLVEQFPADGAGNNNLAVLYTMTAQYERAFEQSRKLLEIYPGRVLYHGNHAQYALYAGHLDIARQEASWVVDQDPDFFKSYMILAVLSVLNGDELNGRLYYDRMAETGNRGQSLANMGLADIDMYQGRLDEALLRLRPALELDRTEVLLRNVGTKSVAIAQALAWKGDAEGALSVIDAIDNMRGDGVLVPAAELYAAFGQYDKAHEIAETYRSQFRPTARAYASLIDGINAFHQDEYVIAIDAFRQALNSADLWLIRFYLGQAYLRAGYPAEAIAEFDACIQRHGEAGGLFFDDVPTLRYLASVRDLRQQATDALVAGAARK